VVYLTAYADEEIPEYHYPAPKTVEPAPIGRGNEASIRLKGHFLGGRAQ
jgi:hypothetical protein